MATENRFGIGQKIRSLKNSTQPNIDIGCQALLIYFIILNKGIWFRILKLEYPFLPFFRVIDTIPNALFCYISLIVFVISVPAILIGLKQRFFSLILGLNFLLIVLSSKPLYSTNLVFAIYLLMLVGFSKGNNWIFRIQIAILYFGAAINKALNIDWWNGVYFENFSSVFPMPLFEFLANLTDRVLLAKVFGTSTIVIECSLAILFFFKKTMHKGIILGLFFHCLMYFLTNGQLSFIYLYVMCTAYLLSVDTTIGPAHLICPNNLLFKLFQKIDLLKTIDWNFRNTNNVRLRFNGKEYIDFWAVWYLFLQIRIIPYFVFASMATNKFI